MLNIYQEQTNTLTISDLYSKVSIPDASLHYLFIFTDFYNRELSIILTDKSQFKDRYSTFYFTDGSDGFIRANGEYDIYESPVDSSVLDPSIMNLLENGQYTYFPFALSDVYYDPSLFTYKGYDVVFSPTFAGGTQPVLTVPHNDLTDRDRQDNHPWALPEASLGSQFSWEDGLLTVDVSGGGSTKDPSIDDLYSQISDIDSYQSIQDASIASLEASIGTSMDYPYVDGSLAARDASIDALFTLTETQDPSISDIYDTAMFGITNGLGGDADLLSVDAGPSGLSVVKGKSVKGGDGIVIFDSPDYIEVINISIPDVDKAYIDASLAERDTSIAFLNDYRVIQDTSIAALEASIGTSMDYPYVDGSLAERDTSISWLDANKLESSDLADYATTAYVDGSLGTQSNWNTTQDASIGLINTNLDNIETSLGVLNNWNVSQDASIGLVNTNLDNIEASIADTTDITGLFLKEASLGTDFYFESGLLEVSIGIGDYASLVYVDGSLSAKQNTIPDGTFVKEASLGDGLYWVDGQLDVSLYIPAGLQDPSISQLFQEIEDLPQDSSIPYLFTYTLDLSTRIDTQDPSISDLYQEIENLPQDPSIDNLYSTKQDNIADGLYLKEASLGSDFVWNAGLLDVSIVSTDASVQDLYNYVDDLSTLVHTQDPSISDLYQEIQDIPQDASIPDLYSVKADKTSVDSSISDVYTYIGNLPQDASIADLYQEIENIPQDASIPYLFSYTLDLSTRLDNFDPAQDGSIVDLYNIKENKTDADSSLADIYTFIGNIPQDTSIADLYQEIAEIPVADVTKLYVDGSLAERDISISWLNDNKYDDTRYVGYGVSVVFNDNSNQLIFKSIKGVGSISTVDGGDEVEIYSDISKAYVDGSLAVQSSWNVSQDASLALKANLNTSIVEISTAYTVLSSDNNKVIEADASLVITLPDSLSTGFQLTIVNAGTGHVTIDASTIRSVGGAKILTEQYAGASAVHKGSGTWYVWGNLE